MAELSLAQAATLTGKSKSTLTRAIKSGRMSAVRRADGTFGLDPAELLRVYPDAVRGASDGASRNGDPVASDAAQQAAQQSKSAPCAMILRRRVKLRLWRRLWLMNGRGRLKLRNATLRTCGGCCLRLPVQCRPVPGGVSGRLFLTSNCERIIKICLSDAAPFRIIV